MLHKCGHWSDAGLPCATCAMDAANAVYARARSQLYSRLKVHFSYMLTSEMLEVYNELRGRSFYPETDYVFNFVHLTDKVLIALDTHYNRNKNDLIRALGGAYLIVSLNRIDDAIKNIRWHIQRQAGASIASGASTTSGIKQAGRANIINRKPTLQYSKTDIITGRITECSIMIDECSLGRHFGVRGAGDAARIVGSGRGEGGRDSGHGSIQIADTVAAEHPHGRMSAPTSKRYSIEDKVPLARSSMPVHATRPPMPAVHARSTPTRTPTIDKRTGKTYAIP